MQPGDALSPVREIKALCRESCQGPTPYILRIPSLVLISQHSVGPRGRAHITRVLDSRFSLWAKTSFFLPLTGLFFSIAVKPGHSVGGAAFLL